MQSAENRPSSTLDAALVDGGEFSLPLELEPTLGAAFLATARLHEDRGVCYLDGESFQEQSYRALLDDAARILGGLRTHGMTAGSPILFQFERNEDFIPAFWACVLGGLVPVPIAVAPGYEQPNAATARLIAAWSLLDRPITLAGTGLARRLAVFAAAQDLDDFNPVAIDDLRRNVPAADFHLSAPDDDALLLLTSGSTGTPKMVRQTHRTLVAWAHSYCRHTGISAADNTLNWMPLDHVGGIVMSVIRDTVIGARQFHAPTDIPLKRPLIWLDWIDRHRIAVTWGPNFVFGLVNDEADAIGAGTWDLSCMRLLLNGGEAVVSRTARRFLALLRPHGLRPDAMIPIWGMSETASGVIFSRRFRYETTSDDDPFAEIGRPLPGLQVRIADERHRPLSEGVIGHMQVRGISVTPGYVRNPEATARSFSPDGWFMTGDLAIVRDGQLAIVGREKDAIIVNGVNFYSHEIEAIAEQVDGIAVSYAAACAVRPADGDSDQLAVFFSPTDPAILQAPSPALSNLVRALRLAVSNHAGIAPDFIVPVAPEEIPKTSLGKIQRNLLKQRFEAGSYATALARTDPAPARSPLFERFWQPAPLAGIAASDLALPAGSQVLVFAEASIFADLLARRVRDAGHRCVVARPGPATAANGPDDRTIDPLQDYGGLLRDLHADGFAPSHLVHALAYPVRPPTASDINFAVTQTASLSLLRLLRAVTAPERPVRLLVVTSRLLSESVPADVDKGPLLGLVHTIRHELDWMEAGLLDITAPDPALDVVHVLDELAVLAPETRIEDGMRCVPLLRHATPDRSTASPSGTAGFSVVSGGRGGIGQLLVQRLVDSGSRVLVLGRSPAPPALEAVLHLVGDVADPAFTAAAIRTAVNHWQVPPVAIYHLAGSYHEADLVDETDAGLLATLTPKLAGAWSMHRATMAYPACRFIAFSSLLAQFSAMSTGAYAASNAGLDAFTRHLRAVGRDAQTILWPSWTGTGIAKSGNAEALRIRGLVPRSAAENMRFLDQAMACGRTPILVGLDAANRTIRQHFDGLANQADQDGAEPASIAPRTPTEAHLARLWCDLLKLPEVGVTSSFFDLGGRSLLAARMFARIDKDFGRHLPLATLYKAPTIEALAVLLEQPDPAASISPDLAGDVTLHALRELGDHSPFFCVPGVGSDVMAFQTLAGELGPSQPFYGLRVRGLDGAPTDGPTPSIVDVARCFVGLIRQLQPVGPYFIAGHCFGALLAWEAARQLRAQGEEIGMLALIDPVVSDVFPADVIQPARLRYSLQRLVSLSMADKARFVLEKIQGLRRIRLVRERLGTSIGQARAMHANYEIVSYAGDVLVILAEDSFHKITPERDPRRHYAAFARDTTYVSVPGNHDSILHAPGAQRLAHTLRTAARPTAT